MLPAVFATTEDNKPVPIVVDRDALSLYTTPKETFNYVETEAGKLESGIAGIRTSLEPYSAWCQDVYGNIRPKVQRVTRFGNEVCAYLRQPPDGFYPRAGIIGFAGVVGFFLARGSRIKRIIYPAGLIAIGSTLYYPEQAVAIGKSTGDSVYDCALQGYVALDKLVRSPSTGPETQKAQTGLTLKVRPH
uniref:MICOS complex subunit n=1 Tax=Gadus morhua TaxID=8049 RepID=A0A8C5AKN5_GADMO